jgi:hypothetical protein
MAIYEGFLWGVMRNAGLNAEKTKLSCLIKHSDSQFFSWVVVDVVFPTNFVPKGPNRQPQVLHGGPISVVKNTVLLYGVPGKVQYANSKITKM